MANTAANVRVGYTGSVYVGATTTPAPTSHNSSLDAGFKDHGYINPDGIIETRDRTVEPIRAWQANAIVRSIVTESEMTFKFVMIETKKTNVETFYGSSVTDGTGLVTIDPSQTGGKLSWVIDIVDGSSTARIYVAEGEVVEVGDVVYAANSGDPIGYEVTVRTYGSVKKWESTLIV